MPCLHKKDLQASVIREEKFYKEIGKRIRQVRESKGISLKDFESRDNGFDKSNLSRIENGTRKPTLYTLHKIASILGVDMAEFLK